MTETQAVAGLVILGTLAGACAVAWLTLLIISWILYGLSRLTGKNFRVV